MAKHAPDQGAWALTRSGDLSINPTTLSARANQWTTSVQDGSALILARVDGQMRSWMTGPRASSEQANAPIALAHAVAANVEPLDDAGTGAIRELISSTAEVVTARFPKDASLVRETQLNADPAETARQLAMVLQEGEWVAVTFRHPSNRERKRHRAWLQGQLQTQGATPHPSTGQGAMVVSMFAGAEDAVSASHKLAALASAMRGFDVPVEAHAPSATPKAMRFAAAAAVAAALAAVWFFAADALPQLASWKVAGAVALGVIALVLGMLSALTLMLRIPSDATRFRASIDAGELPPPPVRRGRPKPPTPQQTVMKNGSQVLVPASPGDYPLDASAFLHAAEVIVPMIAPHAGAASGSSGVSEREVVRELREVRGPRIGTNDKRPVFLSALDLLRQSVMISGRRGSGKSYLLHAIWSWMTLDKVRPSGAPGYPGRHNAMIAFETKSSSGAQEYIDRARSAAGAKGNAIPVRFDVADPSGLGIDVFDMPGLSAYEKAMKITSFLVYIFGDGAIQGRSTETLVDVLTAAMVVDDSIVALADGVEPGRSPFYYAGILLDPRDGAPANLATAIRSEAQRTGDPELVDASGRLDKYFTAMTNKARGEWMAPPRNKVSQLLAVESWWSRPRRIAWSKLLDNAASVVVSTAQTSGGVPLSAELQVQMSQFLLCSLRDTIERTCDGNAARGRWVSIFSDELSMLASESGDVVAWLQEKGRSFGVICVFASQQIEQLPVDVVRTVMGFGTLVSMNQLNKEVAAKFADAITFGGQEWTSDDLMNLERRAAVVRTLADDRAVPAFKVMVDPFFDDGYDFASANGYGDAPAVTE